MILVTAKDSGSIVGKKIQKTMSADKATNLARGLMLMLQPMEETSADLMALKFMSEVEGGQAKSIGNEKNGRVVVFQTYNENEPLPL